MSDSDLINGFILQNKAWNFTLVVPHSAILPSAWNHNFVNNYLILNGKGKIEINTSSPLKSVRVVGCLLRRFCLGCRFSTHTLSIPFSKKSSWKVNFQASEFTNEEQGESWMNHLELSSSRGWPISSSSALRLIPFSSSSSFKFGQTW